MSQYLKRKAGAQVRLGTAGLEEGFLDGRESAGLKAERTEELHVWKGLYQISID